MNFPLEPLELALGRPTDFQLTRLLRCRPDEIVTARAWGWSWAQADRYATKVGFHPAEVWPDVWWIAARVDAESLSADGAA
jgi:hypothetical protein